MNDTYIVTTFVVVDDLLKAYAYQEDCRAQSSAAQVLTVVVVAAKYFHNHHECALYLLQPLEALGLQRLHVRTNLGLT
ncbi:MAG: hypothetical protein KC547_15835 [Anaerolineae bacterium]|nr:hypothetical protein [Anaerolineae bacterium]